MVPVASPLCSLPCYAKSGTDLRYTATRPKTTEVRIPSIVLRERYAVSGTDVRYAATRVLEWEF
eukprot:1171808-Rhodomonas_salina.2